MKSATEVQPSDKDGQTGEVEAKIVPKKGVSVMFCITTLLGTRLGAGIVGVSLAAKKHGYVFNACYQTIHILILYVSFWLLMQSWKMTNRASLFDLANYCYGKVSIYIISVLIGLAQTGVSIIFFIVFGDVSGELIKRAHGSDSFWNSRWFTQTLIALVMLYLVLKKEIHQFKYAGLFLVAILSVFMVFLIAHLGTTDSNPDEDVDLNDTKVNVSWFTAFPTIFACYGYIPAYFTAFGSLKEKSVKNGMVTGIATVTVSYLVYVATPLIAFELYGTDIKANLILNVAEESDVIPTIIQFIFLIITCVQLPIMFFIGKEAVLIIFDEITRKSYSRPPQKVANDAPQQENADGKGIETSQNLMISNKDAKISSSGSESNSQNEGFKMDKETRQPSYDTRKPSDDSQKEDVKNEGGDSDILPSPENEVDMSNQNSPKPVQKVDENASKNGLNVDFKPNPKEYLNMKPCYYFTVTIVTYVIVVLLSITVSNIDFFFGIVGATTGSFVTFLGPGSFYLISLYKTKTKTEGATDWIIYLTACVYTVVGISCMIGLNICVIIESFG